MVFVTKADGSKQPFFKDKVINTCIRMHATEEEARIVADKVEAKVYEGIPTKKVLQMIFTFLKEYKPEIAHQIDLREAISLLRPKPDFEVFIFLLLKEFGYTVTGSQLVKGRCVEHELDAVAGKDSDVFYVEVKHHYMPHTYTGMAICLEVQAVLEDLVEGYNAGVNRINFNKVMVVCNTKFSDHALQYSNCKVIECLGWKAPAGKGLERMIEEKKFYPVTFLKDLDKNSEERLGNAGIVLLRQLVDYNIDDLYRKTGIPKNKLENFLKKAKEILTAF